MPESPCCPSTLAFDQAGAIHGLVATGNGIAAYAGNRRIE